MLSDQNSVIILENKILNLFYTINLGSVKIVIKSEIHIYSGHGSAVRFLYIFM